MEKMPSQEVLVHKPQCSFLRVETLELLLKTPESWLGFFGNSSHLAHYRNVILGIPPSPGLRRFRGILESGLRVEDIELALEVHRTNFTPLFPEYLENTAWKQRIGSLCEIPAAISLLYPWIANYEHYFLEVYPRFELLLHLLECSPSLPILLPESAPTFIEESIRYLGVENIHYLDPKKAYIVKSLYTASATGIDFTSVSECAYAFFQRLRDLKPVDLASPKKIYISRRLLKTGDGVKRVLLNEEDVVALFAEFGFTEVVLEQKTFPEKISLFRSADYIAGPTGAGMFTGVVSQPESTILILDHPVRDSKWYKIPMKNAARDIHHITCSTLAEGEDIHEINSSWHVDIDSLRLMLQEKIEEK